MSPADQKTAVVLVGHGAPALDCPPQLVGELMSLEWRGTKPLPGGGHGPAPEVMKRAAELDAKIRNWPRRPDNDPYKAGIERVAAAMKPMLRSSLFVIAYNEFCQPSVTDAIDQVVGQGATRVLVIPSMLTPGGLHSEIDIPVAIKKSREKHPQIQLEYIWPFDLHKVASLLAAHIDQSLQRGA